MNPRVLDRFRRQAGRRPGHPALSVGGEVVSYGELAARSGLLAAALREDGVAAGDRVLLLLENSAEFVVAYLAILQAHAVAVPYNPAAPESAVARVVDDCGPAAAFVGPPHLPSIAGLARRHPRLRAAYVVGGDGVEEEGTLAIRTLADRLAMAMAMGGLAPPVDLPPEDALAAIIYTSGTTGSPKGVMLTHAHLGEVARVGVEFLALGEDDRVGIAAPLFHLYGLREVDAALGVGATVILPLDERFPTRVLGCLHAGRVTGLSVVPSSLVIWLDRYGAELGTLADHLRYLTIGTAPTPRSVLARLGSLLPATRIILTYGLTEASRVCYREVPSTGTDLGSSTVGHPYPGVSIHLIDEQDGVGQVAVRSKMVMAGYWGRPDATRAVLTDDGALLTPDLGRLEADGALHLLGRVDEVVNCGGQKVNPSEVEEVIALHPGVRAATALGIPDPAGVLGEVVRAVVVRREGSPVSEAEIMSHAAARLEPHKVPRSVEFVESIAQSVLGKPQRFRLREAGSVPNSH